MRIIDADGSFTINATDNTGYSLAFGGGIISCADEFGHIEAEFFTDDIPAVGDVVPVVRCRECRHHHWHQEPCHGKTVHTCDMLDAEVPRNFFCAFAERKDGAT